MIPKVIHYCWFGGNPKSELIEKCISSWKKYAPDYKIIEWNEKNFDVNQYKYSKQAYEKEKWAFVSDVARFHILHQFGGIYLDTDVELIKPIDFSRENELFFAYDQNKTINPGLIAGASQGNNFIKKVLKFYESNNFLLSNGRPNTTTVVTIVTKLLNEEGINLDGKYSIQKGITFYPAEIFDPYNFETQNIELTKQTVSIHHYAASWKSENDMRIYKIGLFLKRILGKKIYNRIAYLKHRIIG